MLPALLYPDLFQPPRSAQVFSVNIRENNAGYARGDTVRHGLRIEGAGRAEGEGQQAGGGKIEAFPEEGQGKGKRRCLLQRSKQYVQIKKQFEIVYAKDGSKITVANGTGVSTGVNSGV